VISCAKGENEGCNGGYAYSAFEFMHYNNVTDETCSTYRARGYTNGIDCSAITVCRNCNPHEPCFVPDTYNIYNVDQFGNVSGEAAMMQEIYQRGPIACGCAVPESLHTYTGGIYQDLTGDMDISHDISIVGYGVENDVPYWVVRNSWGSHWGEDGFFRVIRGVNNINIESDCSWATPTDTWTNEWIHHTTVDEKNDPNNDIENGPYPESRAEDGFLKLNGGCKRDPKVLFEDGEVINGKMAWEEID